VDAARAAIANWLGSASARARGADLLALDAAVELGIRARIVLPFGQTSSARPRSCNPEFWGHLFDRLTAAARGTEDLLELGCAQGEGPLRSLI